MTTSTEVYETTRTFVGTPFRHQGRIPGHGLDCVGVVAKTAHILRLSNYDSTVYQRMATWSGTFESHFSDNMERVPLFAVAPGHVVIFRQEQFPCHCGVIGFQNGKLSLIHAYILRRKVVEERFEDEWVSPDRLMAAFAYRGVEY